MKRFIEEFRLDCIFGHLFESDDDDILINATDEIADFRERFEMDIDAPLGIELPRYRLSWSEVGNGR